MRVRFLVLLISLSRFWVACLGQVPADEDFWQPVRFLIGTWEGTGEGKGAASEVEHECRVVLGDPLSRGAIDLALSHKRETRMAKYIRTELS